MNTLKDKQNQDHADAHQANRWLSQARLDKQALDVMLSSGNDRLSGHVCFLAHEGVEKGIKSRNVYSTWKRSEISY